MYLCVCVCVCWVGERQRSMWVDEEGDMSNELLDYIRHCKHCVIGEVTLTICGAHKWLLISTLCLYQMAIKQDEEIPVVVTAVDEERVAKMMQDIVRWVFRRMHDLL